jgi:hypothetical protein
LGILSRSRTSHFLAGAFLRLLKVIWHKTCAAKILAYTLDSSGNLASALHQNMLFPHQSGIALFSRSERDKGCAAVINPLVSN